MQKFFLFFFFFTRSVSFLAIPWWQINDTFWDVQLIMCRKVTYSNLLCPAETQLIFMGFCVCVSGEMNSVELFVFICHYS